MRIISKFHDYYDTALSFGHDETIVFERKHEEFSCNSSLESIKYLYKLLFSKEGRDLSVFYRVKKHTVALYPFSVLFAKKIYRGVKIVITPFGQGAPILSKHYFSEKDVLNVLAVYGININRKKFRPRSQKFISLDDLIKEYFKDSKKEIEDDFIYKYKISIASMYLDSDSIHINSCLRDFDFYQVFDSYSAFQELDMWISGCLAYPPNFMAEVNDENRYEAHGFDKKYSFRKKPS